MDRCPHGCYSPDSNGFCYACSGCCSPDPLPIGAVPTNVRAEALPHNKKECPKCGSKRFKFVSEWEWSCKKCGFDALG